MASARDKNRALTGLGKARRDRLMGNLPALAKLTDAVKAKAKKSRTLRGLDGRILHVRSEHAALNTLLQSAGAVVMKDALVTLADRLASDEELRGKALFVANVHDEFQMEAEPEIAEVLGTYAADAIRYAGLHFNLKCPLAGSYDIGPNWGATH